MQRVDYQISLYPQHENRKIEIKVRNTSVVLALYGSATTSRKYKGTSSMDYRERRSHARGVYPTQYTSRAWEQQELGADTRVIVRVV